MGSHIVGKAHGLPSVRGPRNNGCLEPSSVRIFIFHHQDSRLSRASLAPSRRQKKQPRPGRISNSCDTAVPADRPRWVCQYDCDARENDSSRAEGVRYRRREQGQTNRHPRLKPRTGSIRRSFKSFRSGSFRSRSRSEKRIPAHTTGVP